MYTRCRNSEDTKSAIWARNETDEKRVLFRGDEVRKRWHGLKPSSE